VAVVEIGLPAATWLSAGGDGLDVLVASGPASAASSQVTMQPLPLPDAERVPLQLSRDDGRTWTAP
jgi:hypothetical protein